MEDTSKILLVMLKMASSMQLCDTIASTKFATMSLKFKYHVLSFCLQKSSSVLQPFIVNNAGIESQCTTIPFPEKLSDCRYSQTFWTAPNSACVDDMLLDNRNESANNGGECDCINVHAACPVSGLTDPSM